MSPRLASSFAAINSHQCKAVCWGLWLSGRPWNVELPLKLSLPTCRMVPIFLSWVVSPILSGACSGATLASGNPLCTATMCESDSLCLVTLKQCVEQVHAVVTGIQIGAPNPKHILSEALAVSIS